MAVRKRNRQMTRLIIFDLDGTLLNTIADLGEACNHALRLHSFAERKADEYPHLVGNGVNKLIERALPEGHKDMETVLQLKTDFVAYYNEHNCVHTRPYPGIPELLEQLKEQGVLLAIASNKYHEATKALAEHYFGGIFDLVLGERPGVERKPDPQIVEDIFSGLGAAAISKAETLYVGDSDVDMQTAHNAGITSIGCTWGFCTREKLLDSAPDLTVDSPLEILPFLQR